jgi:SAM-dependent methyltransferase
MQINKDDMSKKNDTYYDKNYFNTQKIIGERSGRLLKDRFSEFINPSDTVLDFGCGGGFLLRNIACQKKMGFEINEVAIEHAKSIGIECINNLSYLPNDAFDVIISNSCLEHIPTPHKTLIELCAKLKPNGIIVFSVPHETIDYHYKKNDWNNHLFTWSPMALGNLFNDAGLIVIEVRSLKGVQIPFINFFEKFLSNQIIHALSKPYRIFRIILSELGIKPLGIDGNCLVVARRA